MRALFVADAHLCRPEDPNYRVMLDFLDRECRGADWLIMLGDIFEFWIGKDSVTADYAPLIEALEKLHKEGTKLAFVEGNHDFHLGPVFTRRLGCRVFPDGGGIDLDGRRIFLAHGDLANPDDTGYRRLRKLLRSGLVRTLIRVLPNRLLMSISSRMGYESRKNAAERYHRWPARDILKPYAEGILASGYQAVVTGHYHQPFQEKLGDGELIALGDWITQYSYAIYTDQAFTLMRYEAPPGLETVS